MINLKFVPFNYQGIHTAGDNCRSFSGQQALDGFDPSQRTLSFDIWWNCTLQKSTTCSTKI